MAAKTYARRYAQAVFQIAVERDELEQWQSDMEKIAVLGGDKELVVFFKNPGIPFAEKQKLLAEQFSDINPLALNLLYLLVSESSLDAVRHIADEYRKMINGHLGIEQADVVTAVPIDDEEKKKLEERLGTVVGKKVVISAEVDPDIIGGIIARIGGKLIDGSTRGRLERLKEQIGEGRR